MAARPQTSRPLSWPFTWIEVWHRAFVFQRRTRVLAEILATQIPQRAAVLDIGCGDGTIARLIAQLRPDISIQGVEFLLRPECKIECRAFDGASLPFPDGNFDVCLFVDVLHHTKDPLILLREAVRVSRSFVLIKDHLDENIIDHVILRSLDWVGNRPHGVVLTYNYQSRGGWAEHFSNCGLEEESWTTQVPLYPSPASLIFGRGLHFVSLLRKTT
ncbi:MAG TPA: methyltransferase domain-containing protein [Candidatus Acidoferrum sp.]|nr:methyltransferase domain-containing protein [Candidatus Acidoferrum sp.]